MPSLTNCSYLIDLLPNGKELRNPYLLVCEVTTVVSCPCYRSTLHSYMTNCCVVHDGSLPAELTHRNYGGGIAFMEPEPGIESTALLASELVD